jgi:hypothetical protein
VSSNILISDVLSVARFGISNGVVAYYTTCMMVSIKLLPKTRLVERRILIRDPAVTACGDGNAF